MMRVPPGKRIWVAGFGAMLVAVMLAGCATPPAKEEAKEDAVLVFPPPPSTPRFRYLETLCGEKGFGGRGKSFADVLLGETGDPLALSFPQAAAADSKGDVYVVDANNLLVHFDREKKAVRKMDGLLAEGKITLPSGITFGPDDTMYLADGAGGKVVVFDPQGEVKFSVGEGGGPGKLGYPVSVALDVPRGRMYVSDSVNSAVKAYTLEGEFLFTINGITNEASSHFVRPVQIAVNADGYLHVPCSFNAHVVIFNPEGEAVGMVGDIGTGPGSFIRIKGLAFDSDDNLYVSDFATSMVQLFNDAGELLMWLGDGKPRRGAFRMPQQMFVDRHDRLYVVERGRVREGDGCVQIFQYLGDLYYAEHPEEKNPAVDKEEAP